MIDIAEITDDFTAVNFAELAKLYIEQILDSGRIPVIAGGAGLYLEALTGGIVEAPPKDNDIRKELERKIREEGCSKLHEELRRIDPESAGDISPNDPVRVVRALELFELTGETPSSIRKTGRYPAPDCDFLWIGIELPREMLYGRINARVDEMISSGLIGEVEKLVADGMGEALKKKKIVGYAEILDAFEGRYSIQEAIRLIKQHTRNYAKRQMTWFRNRLTPEWINPLENGFEGKVFELIDDYLKRT
jgi:tRNA dimethylallyltransferase